MAVFWLKYGVADDLYIPLVKRGVVDLAQSADWTPAAGDVKLSQDGGADANITTLPSAPASTAAKWKVPLSAAELQCKKLAITIIDSATKAVEDQFLEVWTFGHASAQIQADLNDGTRLGLSALPNAAAAASGGLPTVDANNAVKLQSGTGANQIALTSGAVTVGTNTDKTGYGLSAAAVQAIWDALTSALTTVGSIGKLLVDNVDAAISSRSTYAGADTAGTTTLLGRIASALTITGGKVDVNDKTGFSLSAAGIQAIWDALTAALMTVGSIGKLLVDRLDAAISSRSTFDPGLDPVTAGTVADKTGYRLSATGVDDILDEPIPEPAGIFTWPATLRGILAWLGALGRNKVTQTATTQTLRNDADAADLATAPVSDDGATFTRGEWV